MSKAARSQTFRPKAEQKSHLDEGKLLGSFGDLEHACPHQVIFHTLRSAAVSAMETDLKVPSAKYRNTATYLGVSA